MNAAMKMQADNEHRYARQHIDGHIEAAICGNPETVAKVVQGVALLENWLDGDYYESKNARLAQLRDLELDNLVINLFVGIAYCQQPELFVSVTAQLASRLDFNDKRDAILTVAEITAALCNTDAFDIIKEDEMSSLVVVSRIPLPQELQEAMARATYLPPMVCEPEELVSNYESAHLTYNDGLVLGKQNNHDGDLCLDVLNTQNRVPLQMATDFVTTVEEYPTAVLSSIDQVQQWATFKEQSRHFYELMYQQGNRFWLTNKVDKRGRLYTQGYHITTQGSPYKKAMLELADGEVVTGVPSQYRGAMR